MQHQIQNTSRSALLHLSLLPEESVWAATGALVGRGPSLIPEPPCPASPSSASGRPAPKAALCRYRAKGAPGQLSLAPGGPGEIVCLPVERGQIWYVSSEAFLASAPGLTTDTDWGGAHGFFSSRGVGLWKVEGEGTLFLGLCGALREIMVRGSFLVDTDYVIAYAGGLQYEIQKGTEEKLLCRFLGVGRLLLQSRSFGALARWVEPYRRVLTRTWQV